MNSPWVVLLLATQIGCGIATACFGASSGNGRQIVRGAVVAAAGVMTMVLVVAGRH